MGVDLLYLRDSETLEVKHHGSDAISEGGHVDRVATDDAGLVEIDLNVEVEVGCGDLITVCVAVRVILANVHIFNSELLLIKEGLLLKELAK